MNTVPLDVRAHLVAVVSRGETLPAVTADPVYRALASLLVAMEHPELSAVAIEDAVRELATLAQIDFVASARLADEPDEDDGAHTALTSFIHARLAQANEAAA